MLDPGEHCRGRVNDLQTILTLCLSRLRVKIADQRLLHAADFTAEPCPAATVSIHLLPAAADRWK
jgi:hypothetical protein